MAIYALNTALQYVVTYWGHMLGINIETDMRSKIYDHLQKLSFRFFDNNKTGHLIARVTTDLQDIGELAHHGPEDVFIAVLTLLGAFVLMMAINWQLALLTFVVVPFIIWVAMHFSRKMTVTYRQLFRDLAQFNARIEESVGGIRVVKAFANEEYELELFAVDNTSYRQTKLIAYEIMARSISLSYMLMRFVLLFVMIAGTWFVIQGELSYGEFIAFLLLTNVFFRPIDKINSVIESYPKGVAGFRRYQEILATEPDIQDAPDAIAVEHLHGNIRFEDVCFGYEEAKVVLSDINLSVADGETVAFVGPSGAGKTTLCSLIPRFYDVDGGRISIDDIDIRDMTQTSLRRQIGIVQQDVFLFAGTIAENIAYGKLDASDDEIWDAARRAPVGGLHSRPAGWSGDDHRRAGRQAVRRAEAAPGHRPHVSEESAHPDPGRSDFGPRYRHRSQDPAGADRPVQRAHDAGHRPSAGHHQERRPHRRRDRRRHRRAGPPQRIDRGRRDLQPSAQGAVWPQRRRWHGIARRR